MDFLRPPTWEDALAAKAGLPGALPVQGGTDVMVEINFDARRRRRCSTSPGSASSPTGTWRADGCASAPASPTPG